MSNGNGVKFFNKEDPLIYKIKDVIRLMSVIIIIIAFVVGGIYIKPMKAKDIQLEKADDIFRIELNMTNTCVSKLEKEQAVLKESKNNVESTLKEMRDDIKWLVRQQKNENK